MKKGWLHHIVFTMKSMKNMKNRLGEVRRPAHFKFFMLLMVKKKSVVVKRLVLSQHHRQDLLGWRETPVFFKNDLRVTIQTLGWRSEGRSLPLQDDT